MSSQWDVNQSHSVLHFLIFSLGDPKPPCTLGHTPTVQDPRLASQKHFVDFL